LKFLTLFKLELSEIDFLSCLNSIWQFLLKSKKTQMQPKLPKQLAEQRQQFE